MERVAKAIDDMSAAERLEAVMTDAPELVTLLDELNTTLAEVRTRVGPVLAEVKAGGLATKDGLSYLEAKHLLLLSYCTNIVFYMLLKLEGRPVKEHPVIPRLVQIRAFLDKLRPIDKKLEYQIGKLVKAAGLAARGQALANGGGAPSLPRPLSPALSCPPSLARLPSLTRPQPCYAQPHGCYLAASCVALAAH